MPQLHRCDRTVNKLRSRRTAYKLRQRIAHLTSIRQHLNCQDQPGERVEKDVLLKSIFPTSDRHWIFKLCIVSSIYFFTLVFPPSSIGAVKHWSDLCRQASNFVSAGEYRQAGECYRRALDSNAKADDELVANTLLNLIECLIKTGSYREAQDSLDRANRLLVKMKREDDPIMLRLLRRSRDLNERQERYVEAAQAQSRLVSLRKQIFGSLLNPSSFAELYLLQSIQAKAKQYQESVNTGKLFVALMKEYRLSRKAPYWILVLQNNSESFMHLADSRRRQIACWKPFELLEIRTLVISSRL